MSNSYKNPAIIGPIIVAIGAIIAAIITGVFFKSTYKPTATNGGGNGKSISRPEPSDPNPDGGSPPGTPGGPGGNVIPEDSLEPPDQSDITLQYLKNELERGNQYWQGVRFPSRNVVKDLEGYYWVIDIRDVKTGEILRFKTGEYTIDDFDKKFRDSLAKFTGRILRELIPKNIEYRIFIKGSADILGHDTFQRKFESSYEFKKVDVYQGVDRMAKYRYRYIQKYITDSITEPIRNGDLPNLRAKFMQLKLNEVYPELKGTTILDGDVEDRLGQEYRNVLILLFVDWPENPGQKR